MSQSLTLSTLDPIPSKRQQFSTRVCFFIIGFGPAAWAPLVPFVKMRISAGDGALGLLLLLMGAGSIMAMPIAGTLVRRFGCRSILIIATLVICLPLPFLATASSVPLLGASLFVFGAGFGSFDVAITIQAVIVERAGGRSMMSGFHGLYSLGGIVGAGSMTVLFAAGSPPLAATFCIVVGLLVLLAVGARNALPYGSRTQGPILAIPHGVVLLFGMLCFILYGAEGAVLDWSAVFLTSIRAMKASYAGLGYAAFAIAMTVGRLIGDRWVERYGGSNVIATGGLCAAAGFTLVALVPSWEVGVFGYTLVGLGCSNVVPILFSSVGRQNAMPESVAVPAIATLGFGGMLVGPAVIGLVAHMSSLPSAFLLVALLLLGVAASSRVVPD